MNTTSSSAAWEGKKGEDAMVAVQRAWPNVPSAERASPTELFCFLQPRTHKPTYGLFAVFDGHNGSRAARFAADNIVQILEKLLPPWAPGNEMAAQLQEALVMACLELNQEFSKLGRKGGCTLTLALQVDRLLTVASLGSGRCVLDIGCPSGLITLSAEHRISNNLMERQRLAGAACTVADMDFDEGAVGPAKKPGRGDGVLRLWPGGLALSRSIGDFAISEAVLPLPHIKQVLLPTSGGRLILATDGVWGHGPEVLEIMQKEKVKTACFKVVRAISSSRKDRVDASVIIADVLPPGLHSFKSLCRHQEQLTPPPSLTTEHRHRQFLGSRTKALKMLFQRPVPAPALVANPEQSSAVANAELLADFDSAALLGLVPYAACASTAAYSRSSSASSNEKVTSAQGAAAVLAQQPPTWFVQELEQLMRRLLREASPLWHDARRRRRDADVAAAAATVAAAIEQQTLLAGLVRSHPAGGVKAAVVDWLEASAAAAATAKGVVPAVPSSSQPSPTSGSRDTNSSAASDK